MRSCHEKEGKNTANRCKNMLIRDKRYINWKVVLVSMADNQKQILGLLRKTPQETSYSVRTRENCTFNYKT